MSGRVAEIWRHIAKSRIDSLICFGLGLQWWDSQIVFAQDFPSYRSNCVILKFASISKAEVLYFVNLRTAELDLFALIVWRPQGMPDNQVVSGTALEELGATFPLEKEDNIHFIAVRGMKKETQSTSSLSGEWYHPISFPAQR